MNRDEFDKLHIEEQVDLMNEYIENTSITAACKDIGIPKTTLRDRFKRYGYLYNKLENRYIKSDQEESNKNIIKVISEEIVKKDKVIKSNNNITLKRDVYDGILELLEIKDSLKRLLEKNELEKSVIDIEVNELKIRGFSGNVVNKSYKIDENVVKEFEDLANNKYKHIKKQDLVNQALYEFIKRYK